MASRLGTAAVMAVLLAGCSSSTTYADGAVKHLCGQIINEPGPGMQDQVDWYYDLTQSRAPAGFSVPASATLNYQLSPWLQVSSDCRDGATVGIAPAGHARIVDQVKSGAGTFAAVRLYAYAPGTVEVTVRHDGHLISSTPIQITAGSTG